MSDVRMDLDGLVEDAWRGFREALANALETLAQGEPMRVALDTGDEIAGVSPYVQARRIGDYIVLEVASNRLLPVTLRLPKGARRYLRDLGLARPTAAAPVYSAVYPATHVDQTASVAVSAFREAFGVVHPAFLSSDRFEWETDSGLPAPGAALDAPAAIHPVNREHLDHLIDQALAPMLGHAPHRDSDGDVPCRAGSAVVFLRSHERTPLIRLFAEMVVEIDDVDAAVHEVDALNRDIDGVKFALHDDRVIATADLFAQPFAAEQLRFLLSHVCDVVSSHDAALARRVGGRVFVDAAESSSDIESEDDEGDEGDEEIHPVMLCLLQLDAENPGSVRPKLAARLCGYDSDLLLQLIRWNEEQEIAWRAARDEAYATDQYDEAGVCEVERANARRTVKVLRKALRRVLRA